MFLSWISQLGLLKLNPDSNVLAKFPLNVRKVLISEITQTLLQAHDPNLLSSTYHVKWVMEAIGQGFTLPLEEMTITSNSKELYSQWLFEPNFRPAAIREATGKPEEQEFWQTIFHHYSLFSSTSTPTTPGFPSSVNQPNSNYAYLQHHIELCKGVLIVLTMAGRTLGTQFSEETWLVLLKVILGITDSLLREHTSVTLAEKNIEKKTITTMADELCEHLLRVLFELWLRSNISKIEMWDIFKKCFNQWTYRHQALLQWNATTLAFTQRVVRLLYGPKEGSETVNISVGGYNVGLDLNTDFVYFAWYQMIYLVNNPCVLPSPNFSLAISGIARIVDSFLMIGSLNNQRPTIKDTETSHAYLTPDGNTILNMFGRWLFQACSIKSTDLGFEKGRAEAYGILCRIFCIPQCREKFLRTYITQFYYVLSEGLRTISCLPTILMNTKSLFATELEGVRMMVPDFIIGIKMILPKLAPDFYTDIPLEELRLAAIKVTSTIMCLPNHFEKVSLKENWSEGMDFNVLYSEEDNQEQPNGQKILEPFTALKVHILELLLTSLKTEHSSYNLRYLLHLINVYVIEDVAFCPGLVGLVVKSIQEKVFTMNLPSDVTLYAFDVLKDFVGLYEYVQRDSKNCARELVLSFSRYIDTLLAGSCGGLASTCQLIERAYDCMIRWILAGQWIVGDRDCHEAVILTISKGISLNPVSEDESSSQPNSPVEKKRGRKESTSNKLFSPRVTRIGTSSSENIGYQSGSNKCWKRGELSVKIAADIAMSQFLNHLGNFPAWGDHIGPSRVSTLFNHDLELAKLHIPELVRYFLIDGRVIVGFVEMPKHPIWAINGDPITPNVTTPGTPNTPKTFANSPSSSTTSPGTPSTASSLETPIVLNKLQEEPDELIDAPSVIIVLRDSTGKYSWTSQMRYKSQGNEKSQKLPSSPMLEGENDSTKLRTPSPTFPFRTNTPPGVNEKPDNKSSNLVLPKVDGYTAEHIPSVDKIFKEGSESWGAYHAIKKLTLRQKEAEKKELAVKDKRTNNSNCKTLHDQLHKHLESPQVFRLFMAQIGLLSLENRHRVIPLKISEILVKDLERFDQLNERDCLSASIYYAKSGVESYEILINPPRISEDFERFLNSLGWPVLIESHPGYKAKLDPAHCKTAPYFADRCVEVIFSVPYLISLPNSNSSLESLIKIFKNIASEDLVSIVWLEDITSIHKIPSIIGQSVFVYIFIYPLQNATGLYWIRILMPVMSYQGTSGNINFLGGGRSLKGRVSWGADTTKLAENPLSFGPLVDGMIVSRHTLGTLVRNTTISAYEAIRSFTETNSKPYNVRRNFIDDMSHRYKSNMSISEFYTEIFTKK
nr:3940_t:CDS:10 [Entrophospora candida]